MALGSAAMLYRLRQVTEEDKPWLFELKVDAYRDVVERQFGSWDEALQRRIFNESWKPLSSCIVCVDGIDVGLLVVEDREEELRLAEIQLAHSVRGQGLGSRIMRDLLDRARGAGKPLRLNVLRENYGARRLYESLGFSQIEATDAHYVMQAV